MKKMKRFFSLMLTLSITFTLITTQIIAQNEADIGYKIPNTLLSEAQATQTPVTNQGFKLSPEPEDGILIHSPSGNTYNTWVSYEVVTEGKSGKTEADTQSAVVRFTLKNPGEQPVSFNYTALSGSAEDRHLIGTTTGMVILSQAEPEKDVIIKIAPFADNPSGDYPLPNDPNTHWFGEHFFYIYCSDIQNALFDGNRASLTVPVPVESGFDYEAAYRNAANTKLIDFDQVAGGENGVYSTPESRELKFTAEISGDVRKMIDSRVFTHIHLPQGYFMNESDEVQEVTYHIKARNDTRIPPSEAWITKSQPISLEAKSQTSFYSDGFAQSIRVEEINLGSNESNGIFNKVDFIFDYINSTTAAAIFTSFSDEAGQYLQHQVSFTDEEAPVVTQISTGILQAYYGDEIPVTIAFSEPVHPDSITIKVDGQTLSPMEGTGTISQRVSFLYRIGDEALNTESFTINVTDISGAVDLSGKAQEASGSVSTSVDISFDPRRTFAYCAEPSVSLEQGTGRNMTATVSIPLKSDTRLSNWLNEASRLGEGNISTAVKARAITAEGTIDIPLTIQTDATRVTGLTGSFTAPENNSGADAYYALEIYMDTGSGYGLVDSLVIFYAVQPLILVDDEIDITLDYTYWPPADQIFKNAGGSLSLGYHLNVDATWIGSEYFNWSSSDESVATIDANGNITLTGIGQVFFTLAVTNPLNEDVVSFKSRILTVLEAQDAYLYVPNGIKNQDLLMGSDAKISFSSNLATQNELYGGSGTETAYTFTLYEAVYDGDYMSKGSILSTETRKATAQAPLNSYTVPGSLLTRATERTKYGYILEISARDLQSGITMTAEANIRIRQLPAKASLIRPESVYLLDSAGGFTAAFNIENKTSDTQYELTVTKNSEAAPVKAVASPEPVGSVTVNVSTVDSSRLLDVYTVNLKAKNPSDEAWSYDSYNVYVYNASAMKILVNGILAHDEIIMGYDFEDGEVMRTINFLQNRAMFGMELIKTIKIDDKSYAWSSIADRVTWKVEGESVSLWHDGKRINDEYNPVLLPGTPIVLIGDGSGSSVVTATHTLTGMTKSMTATTKPLNDKLYFFRVYPNVPCNLVYTNGRGETKTVAFTGEVGVYEETGIRSSVDIFPTGSAENVYGSEDIYYTELMANQNSASAFNLYPVNTVKLPEKHLGLTLELYDETTGSPYIRDIVVRGGAYLNNKYQEKTTINGKMGNTDQIVGAYAEGFYGIPFDPSDFTDKLEPSDELSYVLEISFPDNSHLPFYIKIDNDAIKEARRSSFGDVYLKQGIKPSDASSIQNSAIVISQTITIDGEEKSIADRIVIAQKPESAVLDMVVMIPKFKDTDYILLMLDSTGSYGYVSSMGEVMHAYPFSDNVTLHFVCDIRSMVSYISGTKYWPGEIHRFYPVINAFDGHEQIKLSKFIEVQDLSRVPNMEGSLESNTYGEEGDLFKLYKSLWDLTKNAGNVGFNENKDAVKDALGILSGHYLDTSSLGLEIQATDDPLVYKGIIRFAVGSYSKDNPSGVFVGSGEKSSFNFLPGFSDVKAMAKGEYLKKAKEEMNKSRGKYKRYGGGAYIECLVYFDAEVQRWKLSLMYGDFYLGAGGTYYYDYNGWVSFIPVTATFEYNMTAEVGLTILNSQVRKETAYIPRLRPVFSIYGFGGVGFEYRFASFKAGGYGFVEHEQNHLWYTDSNGLRMDGQQLKIRGEVGVEFKIKLGIIWYKDKYVLADYEKSWNFNDYNRIQQKITDNRNEKAKGFLAFPDGSEYEYAVLVPVEESIAFEDRSYLEAYERTWGSTGAGRRMLALMSSEDLKTIWTNAYPDATPQLSDDGEMIVYLSDMGSEDLSDTAILFAVKDGTGSFSEEGTEIDASDYPDSTPAFSGTKEGASAAWVRSFTDISAEAGSEATIEDAINGLAASEIIAGIYKDGVFTSTRLTNNENPDLAPVTAASGNRAITAWRSVTLGSMDNPLDFTSDYIMYSIYDGTSWSEAKCLYDGSINRVQSLNTAVLPDGTSAIVYQIAEKDGDSEIICAVLDTSGEVVRTLRLTDNMTKDVNPQITTAEFHDGVKRFVVGWNAQTESAESTVQMVAVNQDGTLYPEFSLEVSDSTGAAYYSNFQFTKGVNKLEDLSLIWSQPEDENKDGTYAYNIFGTKLLVSDDNTVSPSGKQKLLALEEGRTLDSLDSWVDPYTGKVHFVMLLTEASGESTLATAVSEYKNAISMEEPDFSYADLLPGLDMPVLFTVRNDGIDTITGLNIELVGKPFAFEDEAIPSGESKTYLVSYAVPETIADATYSITAQFGESGDTYSHTGVLKLSTPDVGIYQIDSTKETQRERGFRVLLQNTSFADLKKGTHTVKLEVWDRSDFTEGSPLKTLTVSGDDFDILNNSLLSVDVTLTEDDLQQLHDERGELPDGGAWLLFRTVLAENGNIIEDADISNDMDFVNIYSLIEKNGTSVSLASLSETTDGKTTVQVEAFNNSMQPINNGNIIVTLRDENGNALDTQQTYSSSGGSSLLAIPGEESKRASVQFNHTGYTTDVIFARVSGESSLLSVLNLTGVPMEFNPGVFEYHLKTYGLNQTILTAVAENPESTVSVTKNGVPVSIAKPIAMPYGTTVFVITVTRGDTKAIYTLNVENTRLDEGTDPGDDDPVSPSKPGSGESGNFVAELTIDGIKQKNLSILQRGSRAVVSLGTLAQELFTGNTDVALNLPVIPGAEGYTLEMPANALAGPYTGAAVTVSTELGSLRVPAGMLTGMENLEGKTAGITIDRFDKSKLPEDIQAAIGDRPIVSLTLTLNGEQVGWNNPDAPVIVSISYTPTAEELKNPESIVIWYIDGSGNAVSVPNGRYVPVTGTVTFSTTHFSQYAVAYRPVYFNDVAKNAWYHNAVSFIAARDITRGTGNDRYSPEATLTRGEFIVLLMRACDIKADENPTDNFSDAGSNYYTGYLAAAKRIGISAGVGNNMFAPEKTITRQEMFTLLCNALREIKQLPEMKNSNEVGRSKSLSDFTDEGQIASWAREAMSLLVETGIINGSAGKLTPAGITTRAQMAQVLYNLMTK
ncbi:S-layer homology domain-containing protein [Ruminiclostridium cellobioparum]|uniref:S-layer homology domain-containing protein n=1 Tax=Ruminiclostridium cellobioparum TaxID=29355 RepID=UPI0004837EDF|nr:S-layer homology domain-containing protein [Ruminiclostridium cellobioparum]